MNINSNNNNNISDYNIKGYHYHRESKRNPHLSDIDRNWEKYEKFRERKMAMMRAHKMNVEYRLKTEHLDNSDKKFLRQPIHKEIVKHEGRRTSLDPNWYTENIYSNRSIDNSDEDKVRKRFNTYLDSNGNDDESDDLFIINLKPRSPTETPRYPKSNSCCFGSKRMEPRPFIAKSHSFSTARGYELPNLEMVEYNHKNTKNARYYDGRYMVRTCDREGCMNETCFTISNDIKVIQNNGDLNNLTTRVSPIQQQPAGHYIMNEWDLRNKNSVIEDNDIFNDADIYSFDSYDGAVAAGTVSQARETAIFDNGLDQMFKTERSKILLRDKFDKLNKYTDDFMDDYNKSFDDILRVTEYTSPNNCTDGTFNRKNNIILDIKPSKYDDTSSDASTDTDLELDDFNFDFEKYWMDLEKNDDLDINRNTLSKKDLKTKNINLERYNNNLDHINANDCYNDIPRKSDIIGLNDITSYPNETLAGSPFDKYRDSVGRPHAFSLLNNIFSIYKPNKYSSLNCQQNLAGKNIKSKIRKKLNRSSASRPLGMNDFRSNPIFISSCNRPLMITSSPPLLPSPHPTRNQARFQIIPEKTGLKISPLYRLDYEHGLNSGKHKYKLKSTTRPLTFW